MPETDDHHLATTGIDPRSGKPELVLVIRHLPDPHLWLTARRPVIAHRDAPTVLQHCRAVVRALRERPDTAISDLPILPFPESGDLLERPPQPGGGRSTDDPLLGGVRSGGHGLRAGTRG
ncbi:hypothetical protein ACRAWF_07290 [Streptomyces sp. L7]